ncbi:hypothetical protein TNIN_178961 [Trichonephila inaurata madagascariensis]|uniref:Uncharacterized protein n=1 Tax=Trichonephila inaurata madagascariensis TaxID=2747483 RepID=A0A8X6YT83_9ARAC|nr:hypothetical protein TNIN_178961 [Trichonephila inaurata madagascariensis]
MASKKSHRRSEKNYCNDKSDHYLPHGAVIKENSSTKSTLPVLTDPAEKNSPSINDCLEKGPNTRCQDGERYGLVKRPPEEEWPKSNVTPDFDNV